MKTNQNMIRKMGNFQVVQRTKDGMFNATELLRQWNDFAGMQKKISHFFETSETKEFIEVLENDSSTFKRNYGDSCISSSYEVAKGNKSKGIPNQYWMHPYLFIDFAMWLNPKFKLQVIKFVYDELIKHRHLAGDNYNKLCSVLSKFDDVDYHEIGKMLNYVVFNTHERGIRNIATPEQEDELQILERDMIKYIEMGFVNSFEQFKNIMRKEWSKRHAKIPI